MYKTILVLPGGEALSSGGEGAALVSMELTRAVNDGAELTLGSAVSDTLCCRLTEAAAVSVGAGDTLLLYRQDPAGDRQLLGTFLAEKPVRSGLGTLELTAYDCLTLLDRDLTGWLAGLEGFPYTLYDFAGMVCGACGVGLVNTDIPNGDYPVQKFSAEGITGRQLIRWIGEITGRFCRATADGQLEFAWYTPAAISLGTTQEPAAEVTWEDENLVIYEESAAVTGAVEITSDYLQLTDDGEGNVTLAVSDALLQQYYFQNSLSFADYQTAPIQKVQLRNSSDDVGTVYPDIAEEVNTYIISGNYLLTASTAEALAPIARTLYEQLRDVTYTPCTLSVPTGTASPGQTVQVTDANGVSFTAYIMSVTVSGQRDTLECTGSARRDSSTAVNNQSYQALSGKVLELRTDVDGLKVKNADTQGNLAVLELQLGNIQTAVQTQQTQADNIRTELTSLRQTASEVSVQVQTIQESGVSRVRTATGYTFDEEGLHIRKDGQQIENRLDNTGMYVERSGETILQANAAGVVATDVTVRNYLVVGNARFEDYTDGTDARRTACFWIGG